MFEILSNYGITPGVLQIGIVVALTAVVIGFFWHYILIGSGLLLCFYVFAMPGKVDVSSKHELKIERTLPIEAIQPVETIVAESVPKEYIQDCMRLTSKSKEQCQNLWHEREIEESKL